MDVPKCPSHWTELWIGYSFVMVQNVLEFNSGFKIRHFEKNSRGKKLKTQGKNSITQGKNSIFRQFYQRFFLSLAN